MIRYGAASAAATRIDSRAPAGDVLVVQFAESKICGAIADRRPTAIARTKCVSNA